MPSSTESSLKLFGEAKDQINNLYRKLDNCVCKANIFCNNTQLDLNVFQDVDKNRLQQLTKSIKTIKTVLSRDRMKVACFGTTSNGKSTVLNAILHDSVLPRGSGDTTGCFLQILGTKEEEAFIELEKNGSKEKRPVQSLPQIANALYSGPTEYSTQVKIYWPISRCPLLKYDIVLVDSPGLSNEENLDEWIDEYCHDADVFVLVSNADSILTVPEMKFFQKVSEKLSKPNIFILYNKWDLVADDPDTVEQVRYRHIKKAVSFLSEELKLSTEEEARQRTFFVSARETLQARSPTTVKQNYYEREGREARNVEFINFEKCFEESLSKSAVRTKFKKHTDKGQETITEITQILNGTRHRMDQISQEKVQELSNHEYKHNRIQTVFSEFEKKHLQDIGDVKKRIQRLSTIEFEGVLSRLSMIVEDFNMHFSPNDYEKLDHFKVQLYAHVERYLNEDMKTKITRIISQNVVSFNQEIIDIGSLLSDEIKHKVHDIVLSQEYIRDDLIDLRTYKELYCDFEEDLEFRFSLGLVSIIRRFQSRFGKTSPTDLLNQSQSKATMAANTDILFIMERFILNPPQSPMTIASLTLGGYIMNRVGLRVFIITTAVYGALYAYEYLTWTNSAKERTFKAQYVRYAKKGLLTRMPSISRLIANSVERKMLETFSSVKEEVDGEISKARSKIESLKNSLNNLRICEQFTTRLIAQSDLLMTEIAAFATSFLKI